MALDDKDIFQAICERNPGKDIEFIMAQYEKARQLNKEIEKRDAGDEVEEVEVIETAVIEAPAEQPQPPKKKYSRRNLKVKPENSITYDAIFCCICGKERQSLTAKHLMGHDLTVPEYKKLCNFPPDQPLMSGKRLEESKRIIARAQKARLDKKAGLRGM